MNDEDEYTALLSEGENECRDKTSQFEETALLHEDMVPGYVRTLQYTDNIHHTSTPCITNSPDTIDETCVKNLITEQSNSGTNETEEINPLGTDYFKQQLFELPSGKKYHLFISHSSEDGSEVKDLCNDLEKRFHLKCMNYERDFIPGKLLDDNVHDEMKKSSKILIVMSPSYLDSFICVQEARQAFEMAHADGEHMKVIPILLRPVKKDLPPFLKSYRYIDALKEKNIALNIMETFWLSAELDQLVHEGKEYSLEEQNGARLLTKEAVKLKPFCLYGYVYAFGMITKKESEILKSIQDNDCEEQFADVINLVNSHALMRYYRVFNEMKFSCSAAILLGFASVALVFVFYFLSIIIEKKFIDNLGMMFAIAIGIGLAVWIFSNVSFCIAERKLETMLQRAIWTVNSQYFEENKCIIVFDRESSNPSLYIVRYDTSACKDYVVILLKIKHGCTYNEDKIKEWACTLIKQRLADLQQNGYFCQWSILDSYDNNRHNTFKGKKCLCQLIENDIIYLKEVITV
ncbi:uncharacterized protein LOC143057888 [Mytilus galloprovincialis]|uniref:uncharacterized protein LOC143057888 n=1 Tax=Mytilus galloprovincialis TaxID=29158 RepID=UPI003F7C5A30